MEQERQRWLWRNWQTVFPGDILSRRSRFVRKLPQTQRRMFVLRYWHLYPIREIAGVYDCSESKVKSQLSRTRKELRTYLKKEGLL